MKLFIPFLFFLHFCFPAIAQENNEVVKKGWNLGVLPTITFDTDLGLQYGALVNLYHYGDGSMYPEYNHSLYFEVSRFTKGSGINRFYYDSDNLIEGLHISLDISLLSDLAYDFYGFNGYDAVVNEKWIDEENDSYLSRMFYKYDRKLFRFKIDLLGKLYSNKLYWAGGINFLNFKIGSVNINKLNKGKDEIDKLPTVEKQPGLYENYVNWGIISKGEADGGFIPEFKVGIVYDTRDNRPNPMTGIWSEAILLGVPKIFGAENAFIKMKLTHRQYFTIIQKKLSVVYRLAYQTTIAGDVPFYYQTQMIVSELKGATSEGLGGAKTLRGIRRNSIVGDGFFYGNVEARWKFARFKLFNNNFYLGLNGFIDFGKVTKKIIIDESIIQNNNLNFFEPNAEKMHYSYGAGIRMAMNQNFIVAMDYGIPWDVRDGDPGIYIGLNYLF